MKKEKKKKGDNKNGSGLRLLARAFAAV